MSNDPTPGISPLGYRPWRRWAAAGLLRFAVLSGLGIGMVGAVAWLGASEGGLRWFCSTLVQASDGRLQIDGAGGRLFGEWHARSLRWRDAGQGVEIEQLVVSWSPAALLYGQLDCARLDAASVRLSVAPSSTPATLPERLQIPLAVRVAQLRIGQLWLDDGAATSGSVADRGESGLLLGEAISASLASDGSEHRVERLQARRGPLTLVADARLTGRAPFALSGKAQLVGAASGQRFALDLETSGTLERLQVAGRGGADGAVAGDLQATLAPFAAQPLVALQAHLAGVDPALLASGAPRARLDVDLSLRPTPQLPGAQAVGAAVDGRLRITNRDSGRVDQGLLPVLSLASEIDWRGDTLAFTELAVALAGGGHLRGSGDWSGARLALDLRAQGVDAHALHGALLPTRLSGPLRASLGQAAQRLYVDWRDARFVVSASASADRQALAVSRLQLSAGGASVVAQGQIALSGERRFTVQGRLRDFDPARFVQLERVDLPRAQLNADLDAHGTLSPQLDLALRFALRASRIGGQDLSGKGEVEWSADRLRRADIDVAAAGNRLSAVGAFGRRGDALRVSLVAPALGALGWAPLSGDLRATLAISGRAGAPELSAEIGAARLHLGAWLDVAGLAATARLAAGEQGVVAGDFACSSCAVPAYGVAVQALDVKVDGLRAQHRLSGRGDLPGKRELRFALVGGLTSAAVRGAGPGLSWRGQLSELRLAPAAQSGAATTANKTSGASEGAPLLALVAPAALQIGAGSLAFGPATLVGRLGTLTIDTLRQESGRWQSAGRLRQWRVAELLREFSSLHAWRQALGVDSGPGLVVAGDWDLALGATPIGRAALWRESGDVQVGSVALGLSEARAQMTGGDGRLTASVLARGARLGEIAADLTVAGARPTAAAKSAASAPAIDRQSPWQGSLRAHVPNLAWLGPLLGEGWQVAGQVDGELRLTGSAAHPELSGQLRGERLALRALDLGMRLERGQALLDLGPERLFLRRLRFESDFSPLPRVLRLDARLDAERLFAQPGVLEAAGELALGAAAERSAAHLDVKLDRVGVVQRPGQWVALSGDGQLRIGERLLEAAGKLSVDAAYWQLAAIGQPTLGDDVVVRRAQAPPGGSRVARALKLDAELALGRSAYFQGAGVDSRLAGELRVRSDDAGLPRATGSIRTVDGRFDAYGQKLDIERGIVNFQGAIDNPGLNLLAVRKNLSVEAGVEVSGTALRPQIRLVSTPTVPDAEKLSWLVLGRSPEQQGGDSALLLGAAQTILGGQDGGVLRQLQRTLGIDEFGVASGQIGGLGTLPTSRVASASGFSSKQSVNGQIVSVGKRLTSNAILSYQQSLNATESIVKLTVLLNRQFSVVGSAGTDSALDFFWNYNFGR